MKQPKNALVTGGAAGIGLACAKALATQGIDVTIVDKTHSEKTAAHLNQELQRDASHEPAQHTAPGRVTGWELDLLDVQHLENLVLPFDILVNNAGVQRISPLHEFDPAEFRLVHRLMVEVPFLLMRSVLPHMYANNFGRIINISSVHGLRASAFKSAYVSAKHALEGLSKVAAVEGGPHGVTSNCVNPGYVRTALVENQMAAQAKIHGLTEAEVLQQVMLQEAAIKRLVEPDEVAAIVAFLASDAGAMISGSHYTIDGGWSAR